MEPVPVAMPWTGEWVSSRLGVEIDDRGGPLAVRDLAGLALRRNPRRAHLLVSPLLAKHVPVRPSAAVAAGRALGALVAARLDPSFRPPSADAVRAAVIGTEPLEAVPASGRAGLVLGFAETATGLGHLVAEVLRTPYLHSTRRHVPGMPTAAAFEEVHSHATAHLLAPADVGVLDADGPVVLVDDELSTGATAIRTVEALQRRRERDRYILASLVDVRDDGDRDLLEHAAVRLGCRIDVVALGTGRVLLPPDVLAEGAALVAAVPSAAAETFGGVTPIERVPLPLPVVEGGRHGFGEDDRRTWSATSPAAAAALATVLPPDGRVHVLGTEEFMAWPLAVALGLEQALPGAAVTCSSTTRSPVAVIDEPGYAVRDAVAFPAHDAPSDGPGERYAYNLASLAADVVVVLTDRAATTPALAGLLSAVGGAARRVVVAQAVP